MSGFGHGVWYRPPVITDPEISLPGNCSTIRRSASPAPSYVIAAFFAVDRSRFLIHQKYTTGPGGLQPGPRATWTADATLGPRPSQEEITWSCFGATSSTASDQRGTDRHRSGVKRWSLGANPTHQPLLGVCQWGSIDGGPRRGLFSRTREEAGY